MLQTNYRVGTSPISKPDEWFTLRLGDAKKQLSDSRSRHTRIYRYELTDVEEAMLFLFTRLDVADALNVDPDDIPVDFELRDILARKVGGSRVILREKLWAEGFKWAIEPNDNIFWLGPEGLQGELVDGLTWEQLRKERKSFRESVRKVHLADPQHGTTCRIVTRNQKAVQSTTDVAKVTCRLCKRQLEHLEASAVPPS